MVFYSDFMYNIISWAPQETLEQRPEPYIFL